MSSIVQANVTIQGSITALGTFGQTTYAPVDLGINSLSLATGNLTSLITTTSSAPTGFAAAGEGSLVFPGTANAYIQLNNTTLAVGNIYSFGDFIIEAWVNPASMSNSPTIVALGDAANLSGTVCWLSLTPTGQMIWWGGIAAANQYVYTPGSVQTGTWTHMAVIYQSGAKRLQLYLNGTPQTLSFATSGATSITVSGTVATYSAFPLSNPYAVPVAIGQSYASGNQYNGSLTNLRIVTGSGAAQIYNNNAFTPSTSPLFPASNVTGGNLTTRLLVRVPLAKNQTNISKIGPASGVLAFPPAPMSAYSTNLTGQSSYGQGTYVASASSDSSSNPAYGAFDKNYTTGALTYWQSAAAYLSTGVYSGSNATVDVTGSSYAGEWLQIQLPSSIILSNYLITNRNDSSPAANLSPNKFWLLGSRDGTNWYLIDSRSGIIWTSVGITQTFSTGSSQAFTYFRIVCNSTATTAVFTVCIQELVLNGTIESVNVTADGRVGLGVVAPTRALEVAGDVVCGGTVSSGSPFTFKNAIINGGMAINQRGISTNWASPTAIGAVSGFGCDRWNIYRGGYQTGAVVAQLFLATTDAPWRDGLQYYQRVGRVSGDTGTQFMACDYNSESRESYRFAGQPVTFSFWYRTGSGLSGILTPSVSGGTGIDQPLRNGLTGFSTFGYINLPASNAWQKASVTGFVPTSFSQVNVSFGWSPSGTAGGFDYYDVTGVQLEKGLVATPFEVRPYATELALCYRYYYRRTNETNFDRLGTWASDSATAGFTQIPLPVRMRGIPTGGTSAVADFAWTNGTVTSLSNDASDQSSIMGILRVNGTGFTNTSIMYQITTNNKTAGTAYIDFNAEM